MAAKAIPIAVQSADVPSGRLAHGLRVQLIFPPRAYARMPYLAPYLLKGFIEVGTRHKVDVHDLNLEYHIQVWHGRAPYGTDQLTDSQQARLAAVRSYGQAAWAFMRDDTNYAHIDRARLAAANDVLVGAEYLEREIAFQSGESGSPAPSELGGWPAYLGALALTPLGVFLGGFKADLSSEVIGFSCAYLEQLGPTLLLARNLRHMGYKGIIVIGGSAFTHILHDALRDISFWQDIDYGIPFEGEVTFLTLLDDVCAGDRSFEKANVAFWRHGMSHYTSQLRDRGVVHPVPNFSGLEHRFPTPSPVFPVLTSKGCYWGKCAFCTHHEGYGQGFSKSPDERIQMTIEHIASLGGRHFYFVDEAIPASKIRYLADLFSQLSERGMLSNPAWMAECRVEKYSADPEFLATLANSGCKLIISGMETGSQEVMGKMKKGVELEHARQFAVQCRKFGIQTAWMFFIGFPGETLSQMKQTFDLIDLCKTDLDYATVGTFGLERGAPIWNDPSKYGISKILDDKEPYRFVFDYVDAAGVLHKRDDLKDALREFLSHYSYLMPKFLGIIERSCGVFYETAPAS